MHRARVLFILLFFSVLSVSAAKLEVPADFPTIQAAIEAAVDGDTVLVAEGRYIENIKFNGKAIVVASHLVLDNDPSHIRSTIIDGSQPEHPDTASCVLFINGEDSTSVLEGFTLTGGTGTRWRDEHGAGIYYEGGGIFAALSSPTIKHNIITNNEAIRRSNGSVSAGGGGIRCGDANPKIIGNIISGNQAMYGGGIVMNYTDGLIQNNIIENNSVFKANDVSPTFGGGGIWVNGRSDVRIINNTIVKNSSTGTGSTAAGRGGGVLVWVGNATLINNIVWSNTQDRDQQVRNHQTSISVSYCNIEDGFTGEGNISENPNFEIHNYLLNVNSPAIDAGDPSPEFNDPSMQGSAVWPSLGGDRNDMGAYGGPMRFSFPDEILNVDADKQLNPSFTLEQNFPNPFNPSTTISYTIPEFSNVNLEVFNILGEYITTLFNKEQSAGTYSINWNASGLSSGVYLYRLKAVSLNDQNHHFVNTRSMTLLK